MCLVTVSWQPTLANRKVAWHENTSQVTWAYVEPTTACNLNCSWCYAAATNRAGKFKQVSPQQMANTLDLLVEAGIKQVTFGGGEPLMYPDLPNWVARLSKQGVVVHLNSNAFFLTQDLARQLADCGLEQIQTNIESIDPETHDRVRGRVGAHQRALAAIGHALEASLVVTSQIVATQKNITSIPKVMAFVRGLGVQRCRVWDMTPSGRALEQLEMAPEDYPYLLRQVIQTAFELGATTVLSYDPLFPLGIQLPLDIIHVPCPSAVGMLMTIDVNGNVIYCCTERTKLYNILEVKSGQELISLHRQKINAFNREYNLPAACVPCKLKNLCRGGCITRRKFGNGVDYQCQQAKQEMTKQVIHLISKSPLSKAVTVQTDTTASKESSTQVDLAELPPKQ